MRAARRLRCGFVPRTERRACRLLAPPSYIIDGNLSVRLKRGSREVFVWKKSELDVTPERLEELAAFGKT